MALAGGGAFGATDTTVALGGRRGELAAAGTVKAGVIDRARAGRCGLRPRSSHRQSTHEPEDLAARDLINPLILRVREVERERATIVGAAQAA